MKRNQLFFISSLVASIFSFVVPYFVLPSESYISKGIPELGYFMPKTLAGWFFVILGLFFLTLAFINARKMKSH
jgi:hypothetical protein